MPRGGKRKGVDNKAASQSLIDPAVEAAGQSFFCSVCGTGHDFKTRYQETFRDGVWDGGEGIQTFTNGDTHGTNHKRLSIYCILYFFCFCS